MPSLTPVGQTYAHSRISSLCYCTFNNSASVSLRLPPLCGRRHAPPGAHSAPRVYQPHMHAMAVVCLGAPACSGVRVTKQRDSVPGLWCVPTGEIPVYLREKPLCTYGRSAVYLREKKHALILYF